MERDQVVYIAGHRGMVGSALVRRLTTLGYRHLLTTSHAELDLLDQAAVQRFFATQRIDQVYLAAARVGGIHANNTYPADFIYPNPIAPRLNPCAPTSMSAPVPTSPSANWRRPSPG